MTSLFTQPVAPPRALPRSLERWLDERPVYESYAYGYPHKTAYRPFAAPRSLDGLWDGEDRSALFLYVHLPFCEMRCGFCNLFTQARPAEELHEGYVQALERQAKRVRASIGPAAYARIAFGGGTPTQLPLQLLERFLDVASTMGARAAPSAIETSPETSTPDRLALLAERGFTRISIGIQSFSDAELAALGRPVSAAEGVRALDRIRSFSFPVLNVDLIYGVPGQTETSWLRSVQDALRWQPEEVFLYPLYLRPLTGLGKKERTFADQRPRLYRLGRDFLLAAGYEQRSMRMFRHTSARAHADEPAYTCQEDGMVGLGCGARSYTRGLHYSDEWATGAVGVKAIIAGWIERSDESFDQAWYGISLDAGEQRRRFIIQSLLHASGLSAPDYRARFGTQVMEDHPELREVIDLGLAENTSALHLTPRGFELSDCLGPWLYSDMVRERMREFDLR